MDAAARVDPSARPTAGPDEAAQARYAWRALSVVGPTSVLVALNASTLNVALPDVVRHFGASPLAANWILLSYMLAGAVLLLAFGRLGDLFDRRATYLAGLSVFTLASLLLGLAPNVWVLIGLRVVQAAGGAMLTANSAAIIVDAFPPRLLSQGMGIYAASFSAAQLVGPVVGGLLADHAGWRWVFWFNVPVGMLCLLWGAVMLRPGDPDAEGRRRRIDVPGNLIVFLALGSLLFALSRVQEVGRVGPMVVAGFGTFVVLLPIFFVVEHRSGSPLVDLGLFRRPPYALANLAAFVNSMARFAVVLLMALFFRAAHADSAFAAGLKVMPLALGTVIASTSLGLLARWIHPRSLAALGSGVATGGLIVLFFAVDPDAGYGLAASGLALTGLGTGIFLPANTTAIMADLPSDRLGTANALRLLLQRVGVMTSTALGLAIVTGPLAEDLRDGFFSGTVAGVSDAAVAQLVAGYHRAFVVLAGISALGVAACLASRRVGLTSEDRKLGGERP
ncbi:MAG: MFS transporter [Streptosporangiales bacterium]|nr:MFS transporter [Streptosporangiales bacterium]